MKQYTARRHLTIGNGLGHHRFSPNQSYTEKALQAACLTAKQIAMYFSTDKKAVRNSYTAR